MTGTAPLPTNEPTGRAPAGASRRPSEAARQALRAARRTRNPVEDGQPPRPAPAPAPPEPADRPGDVARRALRTARARRITEPTAAAPADRGPAPRPAPVETPGPAAAPEPTVPLASTWWGTEWIRAMEDHGPERLLRGRGHAAGGRVGTIAATPGRLLAYVQDDRPRPYRAQLELGTLTDQEWDAFLDAAAEHPGHLAALLDGELPPALADCGALLPGPGDLTASCGCPGPDRPCRHAAALGYAAARLVDEDPFVLLRLRGRSEDELLTALSRRAARTGRHPAGAPPLPGVRARTAFAVRALPALPPPLPVLAHPEAPPSYPSHPDGPDPYALDQLASDAAARAHALLTTGHDPLAGLTPWQDAVRWAAARPGSGLTATTRAPYASLAAATGRTTTDLRRAVAAWRQGGAAGLTVLEEPWDPPAGRFDRARPALLAAGLPPFRPVRNHLTHPRGHRQLRLGRDALWYAYESEPGHDDWWPRGTPATDPVSALTGLDTTD
ncbi:SWIM zinc finger family protein [Streptomyces sp. LE64]|uniref:SWIM zinc finger family protein n=1 Tax=Streptomyces sp. LE64 TaxID=3448653 RepID=UPI004041B0BC